MKSIMGEIYDKIDAEYKGRLLFRNVVNLFPDY
jgi:hypothetical protein